MNKPRTQPYRSEPPQTIYPPKSIFLRACAKASRRLRCRWTPRADTEGEGESWLWNR
jgi:hypothetical protein